MYFEKNGLVAPKLEKLISNSSVVMSYALLNITNIHISIDTN